MEHNHPAIRQQESDFRGQRIFCASRFFAVAIESFAALFRSSKSVGVHPFGLRTVLH